ncbi:MAG: hypothetical protein LBJ83_00220 [Oscillospiraceae bacterium]|jgi:hypothetical protein|nr:hypothetical protein [Oscillospiraceae bacterium]
MRNRKRKRMLRRLITLIIIVASIIFLIKNLHHHHKTQYKHNNNTIITKTARIKKQTKQRQQQTKKTISLNDIYNPLNWHEYAEEIKARLMEQKIIKAEPMHKYLEDNGRKSSYSSEVYKVTLEDGTEAVFKIAPKCHTEELAFNFSVYTKLAYLPPIVFRSVKLPQSTQEKNGFLSLFVKTDIDAGSLKFQEFKNWLNEIPEPNKSNYSIFNFVFGNYDAGPLNILLLNRDNKQFPILIDNECLLWLQKVKYGDLPFIRWHRLFDANSDSPFPFDKAKEVTAETRKTIKKQYGYFPNRRVHNYIIFNGYYWLQFIEDVAYSFLLYPDTLPKNTIPILKSLTKERLEEIVTKTHDMNAHKEAMIDGILERRDAVLKHFGEL